jgi:hypothetical protein
MSSDAVSTSTTPIQQKLRELKTVVADGQISEQTLFKARTILKRLYQTKRPLPKISIDPSNAKAILFEWEEGDKTDLEKYSLKIVPGNFVDVTENIEFHLTPYTWISVWSNPIDKWVEKLFAVFDEHFILQPQ